MRKILYFLIFLALLAGGAFFALQHFLSPEFVAAQLQNGVKSSTGRDLKLGTAPRLSYWPKLSVELENASLSNPPEMTTGTLAEMNRLRVSIDVWALVSRKLQIEEISLDKPNISLHVDANGKANWSFDTAGTPAASNEATDTSEGGDSGIQNPLQELSLAPIQITNGQLNYADDRSGKKFSASDVNITVTMPSLESSLKMNGTLVWNGKQIDIATFIDAPQKMVEAGSIAQLTITSEPITANYSGEISFQNGFGLTGQIETDIPSIRKLAEWAGSPMAPGKGIENFNAKSAISVSPDNIALTNGRYVLDTMNAKGNLAVDISNSVPFISGNLGLDKVDVNAYLDQPPASASGTQGSGASTASSGWSNEAIDFSGLRAVNAKLNLVTANIFYEDVVIGRTKLSVALNNGTLDTTLGEMAFYDGGANGRVKLSGASKQPALQLQLNASGINGSKLLKDFADFDRITGVTGLNVNVTTVGRSQKEFVSNLNGTTAFKFEDGALRGINIPQMIRSVQSNILGGWESSSQEKTDFSVFQATFNIQNGIASNNDLQLVGPLLRVTGEGLADMPNQAVDYRVEPKLVGSLEGQGGDSDLSGLKVPVIIKGPWASPKIYPDIKGILEDPQAAFDALKNLTGKDLGVDLSTEALEDKANQEVEKVLDKIIPEEAQGLLGDDAVKEQGKKLLQGIFGNSE